MAGAQGTPGMSAVVLLSISFAALLLIVLAVGLARFRDRFRRREALLTRTEVAFLWALERAIAANERVMVKVRLIDVLEPAGAARAFVRARRRLQQVHVDFLVCHRDTLAIRYAIELDGRAEDSPARRERDAFVDMAMKSAGVRLYKLRVRDRYTPEEIQRALGSDPKSA